MNFKYRIHYAPSPAALEQAARVGSNMAVIYSVGPCSHLWFARDPVSGRDMDEFPIYFDAYPKVAAIRHGADSVWIEPLRQHIRAMCARALTLGLKPVIHFYEPMLPLVFEREYPEFVGIYRRPTQDGTIDLHTRFDPDNPATWTLMQAKYREIAEAFPEVGMFIITTGDIATTYWCMVEAKMPVAERLARNIAAAREGIRQAGSAAKVCCRLWWRNFPEEYYRDGHRLAEELTGLKDATRYLCPVGKPYNDPATVLPALFKLLPADVPVMYKSTRMDIHDSSPLTHVLGRYPAEREQIIEVSFEMYHKKPWPWCKIKHIRQGYEAARDHRLSGYMSLPINVENNDRSLDPEKGNLGRMNTWLLEQLAKGDARSDAALVAAWLEQEFGAPQPQVVVDALLDADRLASEGIQWGRGIQNRMPFASLHTTKLYWTFDGFIQPDFPYAMAKPTRELLEGLIAMKHAAYDGACAHLAALEVARDAMSSALYGEIHDGYQDFAEYILLVRDWSSYLLMQYGIERGVFPADRPTLGRMSRYVERFIRNLTRLRASPAGQRAIANLSFPDAFPLT
ncbi:MAG: hypothetical protein WCI17_00245 [bacterium]